jgi:hypothetical protein
VNEGKVSCVECVVEIVVVVVNLDGGQLTLVDNVGGVESTDVEAFLQTTTRQYWTKWKLTFCGWQTFARRKADEGRTSRRRVLPLSDHHFQSAP